MWILNRNEVFREWHTVEKSGLNWKTARLKFKDEFQLLETYLRREFSNMCFFTEISESNKKDYICNIEHFRPQSRFKELTFDVGNLYLANKKWNETVKSNHWNEFWVEVVKNPPQYLAYLIDERDREIRIVPKIDTSDFREKIADMIEILQLNRFEVRGAGYKNKNGGKETIANIRYTFYNSFNQTNFPSMFKFFHETKQN